MAAGRLTLSAAGADVPRGHSLQLRRALRIPSRCTFPRCALSAAEECTGAPGLGTPGCSPSPVDYAIYGIIHSACGAHRKPAAIHRYVPPGSIRNGLGVSWPDRRPMRVVVSDVV